MDTNVTYHATKPQYDIEAIKAEVLYDFLPDNVKANVDKLLSDIAELNAKQSTTESAVKVAYSGSTTDDRRNWLVARIEAIYNRLDLIRSDVEGNKQQIIDAGGTPPAGALATIGAVLAVIPATRPIGVVASAVGRLVNRSNDNQGYKQTKINEATYRINNYASDVQQLTPILKSLQTELQNAPNPNSLTYSANTAWPTWYYAAIGVGVIVLLLLYMRNRNNRR